MSKDADLRADMVIRFMENFNTPLSPDAVERMRSVIRDRIQNGLDGGPIERSEPLRRPGVGAKWKSRKDRK